MHRVRFYEFSIFARIEVNARYTRLALAFNGSYIRIQNTTCKINIY